MSTVFDHPVITAYLSDAAPHPAFLHTTAVHIVRARAARLRASRHYLDHAADMMLRYAHHLDGPQWWGWTKSCADAGLDQPTGVPDRTTFDMPGFYGTTWGECWAPYGVQKRTFDVFDLPLVKKSAAQKKGRHVARLTAVEHLKGLWEVADVVVREDMRRQGIATDLYAAVEQFIGAPIPSPSGWLTADALAFWAHRRAGMEAHFAPVVTVPRLYLTERQARFILQAVRLEGLEVTRCVAA